MGEIIAKELDTWDSMLDGIPYGLYLYYIDDSVFNTDMTSILGNCSAIQSVQYTPFLEPGNMIAWNIPYDVERFGKPESTRPMLDGIPQVFRIMEYQQTIRTLGTFNLYDTSKVKIKGERSFWNESRLYNFPYSFALLTDYLNQPMQIKYHLCSRRNTQTIKVKQTISDRCSYGLFLDEYKNDVNGKMESTVSTDAHELPCSSSAYSQWFASSKNQATFAKRQSVAESFLNQKQASDTSQFNSLFGAIGGLGQAMGGNLFGGLATSGQSYFGNRLTQSQIGQSGAMQRQGIVGSMMAQQKDIKNTPNTLISMGSDVMYGLKNGEKRVDVLRYMVNIEYAQKLGDYFAMYGYKQNKIRDINKELRNRYYYNYIKTVGVNLKTRGIPKSHVEELQRIYDNGVTIWHMDRDGVTVGDYSKDNYEV